MIVLFQQYSANLSLKEDLANERHRAIVEAVRRRAYMCMCAYIYIYIYV